MEADYLNYNVLLTINRLNSWATDGQGKFGCEVLATQSSANITTATLMNRNRYFPIQVKAKQSLLLREKKNKNTSLFIWIVQMYECLEFEAYNYTRSRYYSPSHISFSLHLNTK